MLIDLKSSCATHSDFKVYEIMKNVEFCSSSWKMSLTLCVDLFWANYLTLNYLIFFCFLAPAKGPTITKISPKSTELEVLWERLSYDDSNGIITNYSVCYQEANGENFSCAKNNTVADQSTATLTGLKVATNYTIAVKAATSKRFGPIGPQKIGTTLEAGKRSKYIMLVCMLKVAPYSFLKSGKHMFQTQNLVHWYFVRRMKLNVWYRTAFWESETVTKKCVTVVAMATMTFQNGS